MIDCTIICVYNKKEILNNFLESSLKKQKDVLFETKFIDNSSNKFKCARDAISSVLDEINGKYIIICHQDIEFTSSNALKELLLNLSQIKKFGIAGIAGVIGNKIISNIYHGVDKKLVTSNNIRENTLCETLDECLFIIPNKRKYIIEFKKLMSNSWHLYAVEYCLKMKILNEKVYVIPSNIYHASSGASFDNSYYRQLKLMAKKYRKEIKKINTTMGFWHTNKFLLNIDIHISKARMLKNKLIKKN